MMHEEPEIVNHLAKFLQVPIPRTGLKNHIIGLEALRFDLAKATADQLRLLQEKRKQMLWPKDAERNLTELDRNIRLNGDVAIIERDYELLRRLENIVKDRLEIAIKLVR